MEETLDIYINDGISHQTDSNQVQRDHYSNQCITSFNVIRHEEETGRMNVTRTKGLLVAEGVKGRDEWNELRYRQIEDML